MELKRHNGKTLVNPSIEEVVKQRLRLSPDTAVRVDALAAKWAWGKTETYEFLLRDALPAYERMEKLP
jgi:hypothetical protein